MVYFPNHGKTLKVCKAGKTNIFMSRQVSLHVSLKEKENLKATPSNQVIIYGHACRYRELNRVIQPLLNTSTPKRELFIFTVINRIPKGFPHFICMTSSFRGEEELLQNSSCYLSWRHTDVDSCLEPTRARVPLPC